MAAVAINQRSAHCGDPWAKKMPRHAEVFNPFPAKN